MSYRTVYSRMKTRRSLNKSMSEIDIQPVKRSRLSESIQIPVKENAMVPQDEQLSAWSPVRVIRVPES